MSPQTIRTIAHRAWCEKCMETVSPDPRLTITQARQDLRDHNKTAHPRKTKKATA